MNRALLVTAVVASLALAACQKDNTADTTAPDGATAAAAAAAEPTPVGGTATPSTPPVGQRGLEAVGGARLSSGDDLVLGLPGAVNENEVAAAKQAQEKTVTGPALECAQMMETQHTANLEKTNGLGTLAETRDVEAVKDMGAATLTTLGQQSGTAYAAAYIDAMITGHEEALAMIDGEMTAAASADPVKQHLAATRTAVQQHLADVQEIKASM